MLKRKELPKSLSGSELEKSDREATIWRRALEVRLRSELPLDTAKSCTVNGNSG